MTIRNLEYLLAPHSVVLVGASDRKHSIGAILTQKLLSGAFKGDIWLINPTRSSIRDSPCFPNIDALPKCPDLAIVATPPDSIPKIIDDLGRKGCRAAVIITAGIRGALRQAMLDAAKLHLLRIQGPNCLGLMLPPLGIDASFALALPPAGKLAFLSQSGALITGIVDWAASRGIGFSHVVSMGDMADVDAGDLLDYLAGDAASQAILLYLESVTDARKFMSAARRAARVKPVIVIKAGRHAAGASAALSHTGALAGSDKAFEAAFRRAGLLRVRELGDLFSAAEVLAKSPALNGERLAVVTNGGGAGVLAADRLADVGIEVAPLSPETIARLDTALPSTWSKRNPIDIVGDADADRFGRALDIVLKDPGIDAALVLNCPTAINSSLDAAVSVTSVVEARRTDAPPEKAVLTCWLGASSAEASRAYFSARGIATFDTPADAVDAFAHLASHRRAQKELMATPPALPDGIFKSGGATGAILETVLASGRAMLTEVEAKALLSDYGIPVAETLTAETPEDAVRLAGPLLAAHGSCALKILSVDITHKSDVGGIRLNLESADQIHAAAVAMLERVRAARPQARIDGFTVQPMVSRTDAHELLLGISIDPTFGPLITFGTGGVAVEAVRDIAHALTPLDLNLAHDLMRQTRTWRLLQGYRNRPPADSDAIAATLVRLGYLAACHPEVREIDINPLLADERGVIALDARIRIADEAKSPRTPMAIKPYPVEWERAHRLPSLGSVLLRPVRPEDETLYKAFFAKLEPADIRLRFFLPKIGLTHGFLARLTQIDYAREMAFVAIAQDDPRQLLGVARFIADPDFVSGEFGVIVRSDIKGKGLGWALMTQLIDYARAAGLSQIYGHILARNTTMIAMCADLGFAAQIDADDPELVRATLTLSAAKPAPG